MNPLAAAVVGLIGALHDTAPGEELSGEPASSAQNP
jgi:hypothetical protein